jgi:phospholipid transport system substrate-binding protein
MNTVKGRRRLCLNLVLLGGLGISGLVPVAALAGGLTNEAAEQLVQNTADQVIHEIAARQTQLDKDPGVLLDIVDSTLLPVVDSKRMSRLVLGRYWRTASASQKAAFIEQFKRLLVRTYAGPLSKLGNQTIKVTGSKPGSDKDEVEVLSVVIGGDMGSVPVDYRLAVVDGKWKAYDVVIDGISLVNNYRGSFAQAIQQKGLDHLIATLKTQNNG